MTLSSGLRMRWRLEKSSRIALSIVTLLTELITSSCVVNSLLQLRHRKVFFGVSNCLPQLRQPYQTPTVR